MRPSWVEIDLGSVAHNVETIAGIVTPARLCTVVKADGYGHGDVPVAVTALENGASMVAVALVEEAVRLREAGVDAPILLLSECASGDLESLIQWAIMPTVYQPEFLRQLREVPGWKTLAIHLKVDTGMHRAGNDAETILGIASELVADGGTIGGVWTHLAVAEADPDFTRAQVESFDSCLEGLAAHGIDPGVTHIANTAGGLLHESTRRDLVRVGLGTYGLHPSDATRAIANLRPAMRVVSHVSHVRRHPGGTRPSYGRRRPLAEDSTVVSVPIGYADGVPRLLSSNGGEVLIGGARHPLAGTVTMDQIVVDVGDHDVSVADEVVLIGVQGDEHITADDWARATGTINYEIVCGLGPRLPRRYSS